MRISDWSSDVCSSDLTLVSRSRIEPLESRNVVAKLAGSDAALGAEHVVYSAHLDHVGIGAPVDGDKIYNGRSEEHTSELQSLMRISYAVFCLKKKIKKKA